MMLMQSPGAFALVAALYLQPGTNWTSYFPFIVSGTLQTILLCMCIAWHFKEKNDILYTPIEGAVLESSSGSAGYTTPSLVIDNE